MFRVLRAYLELKDINHAEFAEQQVGISPESFSNKLNGRTDFKLKEAKKIADYFGKTIDEIFFGNEVNI